MKTRSNHSVQRLAALAALILGAAGTTAARADDHGDSVATATPITAGITPGTIENAEDFDYFTFSARATGITSISILPRRANQAPATYKIEILDPATGRVLRGAVGNFIEYVFPIRARYAVRVRGVKPSTVNNSQYRLKLVTPEAATAVPSETNIVQGSLTATNDIAFYSFTMPAPGLVNLAMRPPSPQTAPINTIVELFDNSGRKLNISASGLIRMTLQQAGRYNIRVKANRGLPNVGAFAVQVLCQDRATPLLTSYSGSFDVAQDCDYLKFTVASTRRVRLTANGTPIILGRLYGTAGNLVATAVSSARTGLIIDRSLPAGNYFLLLEPHNGAAVKTGSYQVILSQ